MVINNLLQLKLLLISVALNMSNDANDVEDGRQFVSSLADVWKLRGQFESKQLTNSMSCVEETCK